MSHSRYVCLDQSLLSCYISLYTRCSRCGFVSAPSNNGPVLQGNQRNCADARLKA